MAITAFIVKVPTAEPLVGALREQFDETTKLGVPAHITILVPFMDPKYVDAEVLKKAKSIFARTQAFSFRFQSVGRFPETAYLAPEPLAPFIAMTRALAAAFPDYPPYAGIHEGTVPHLTVAHGSEAIASKAEEILRVKLAQNGPIHARCTCVTLIENASGHWRQLHTFQLG